MGERRDQSSLAITSAAKAPWALAPGCLGWNDPLKWSMVVSPLSHESLEHRLWRVPLDGSKRCLSFVEITPPPLLTSTKVALTLSRCAAGCALKRFTASPKVALRSPAQPCSNVASPVPMPKHDPRCWLRLDQNFGSSTKSG